MALPGYHYEFPRDHFNHPDYKTEWWYYTGNLTAADGHRFGYRADVLSPGREPRPSKTTDWDIQDLYLAHLALSDLRRRTLLSHRTAQSRGPRIGGRELPTGESLERQLAGAVGQRRTASGSGLPTTSLCSFVMSSQKPPVIHGKNGVSQKSAGAGHASHYISFTRLLTSGSIELNGKTYQVDGTSWMDHEFFTHRIDEDQSGWDWLSLQFDDNTELMLYRLRHKDGSVDPFSSGTYVDAKGKIDVSEQRGLFHAARSGNLHQSRYPGVLPIAWRVTIPSLGMDLQIRTALRSQEMAISSIASLSYWEGAITISGTGAEPR